MGTSINDFSMSFETWLDDAGQLKETRQLERESLATGGVPWLVVDLIIVVIIPRIVIIYGYMMGFYIDRTYLNAMSVF